MQDTIGAVAGSVREGKISWGFVFSGLWLGCCGKDMWCIQLLVLRSSQNRGNGCWESVHRVGDSARGGSATLWGSCVYLGAVSLILRRGGI